jgi:L-arabinose isomerase
MPTKAELRSKRLAKLASSMRDLASPDMDVVENLEDYDQASKLWNLGDLFEDMVAPVEAPVDNTFHQPQPNREVRKPVFRTFQDTRPPRGVRR